MGANSNDAFQLVGLGRGRGRSTSFLIKQQPNEAGNVVWNDFYFASTGSVTYTIIPTGSVTFSGSLALIKERVVSPTGNIVFSGTAPITFVPFAPTTYTITPTGSITFSGSLVVRWVRAFSSGGTLSFSGTAEQLKTRVQVPTGTVNFSGAVVNIKTKVLAPTGSLLFSGTAPITFNGGVVPTTSTWRTLTGTGL